MFHTGHSEIYHI